MDWDFRSRSAYNLTVKGQTFGAQLIAVVGNSPERSKRIRLVVEIDSPYPAQSHLHADIWTPSGWAELVKLYGNADDVMPLIKGKGSMPADSERAGAVDAVAALLMQAVDEILA